MLSHLTNSRIQGQHRHSFWNDIYETVLAPYIFLPTVIALVNPRRGSFQVTAKGGVVNRAFFDARIAQPFIALLLMNFLGLLCAIPRALQFPLFDRVHPASGVNFLAQMYDGGHAGTIAMNVAWTLFNITILGVAMAVAWREPAAAADRPRDDGGAGACGDARWGHGEGRDERSFERRRDASDGKAGDAVEPGEA